MCLILADERRWQLIVALKEAISTQHLAFSQHRFVLTPPDALNCLADILSALPRAEGSAPIQMVGLVSADRREQDALTTAGGTPALLEGLAGQCDARNSLQVICQCYVVPTV